MIEERIGASSTSDRISGAALGDARQATDPELMMLRRKRRFGNDRAMNDDTTLPLRRLQCRELHSRRIGRGWIRPLVVECSGAFTLTSIGARAIMTTFSQGPGDGGTLVASSRKCQGAGTTGS
jgi:hypothetical protein